MTGHGGWPLTVFLTPEGDPFYGGTYFPPEDRVGMPGFPKVLEAVAERLPGAARGSRRERRADPRAAAARRRATCRSRTSSSRRS